MTDPRPKLGGRGWARIVKFIVARDRICQLRYPDICTGDAETADHKIPRSLGGSDDPSNLRGACRPCNQHRGNGPDQITDRDRWSRNWTDDSQPWGQG